MKLPKLSFIIILFSFYFQFINCRVDKKVHTPDNFKKVDCNIQQYRMQNLCEDEKQYLDDAAKFNPDLNFNDLDRNVLQKITLETKDVDIAAALYYQRLLKYPSNKEFLYYIDTKEKLYNKKMPDYSSRGALFLMVPGMFYKDNTEVDASGKSMRELVKQIGLKEGVINVEQSGDVDRNAVIICNYLKDFKDTEVRGIILVSASKGSGDIKRAIARCGKEPYFNLVRGWFNIGGITKGSMIVDGIRNNFKNYIEARLYFLIKRYNWKGLMSIRHGDNAPLSSEVDIPSYMTVVSIVGIPLFRHVTPRARPYYEYLIRYGPSDGMVLLSDAYIPGGYIFPSFRNDHYFQYSLSKERMAAILSFIIEKKF